MKGKILAFLFVSLFMSISLAIQPVANWTAGAQQKITYTGTAFVTEGGNITELNISQNISTEKWAGIWGNISGAIVLSTGSGANFYTWTWTSANGGTICAQPNGAAFDWTTIAATTAGEVDTAFSFTTTDVDSATNTLTGTCTAGINIGGTTYGAGTAPSVTASGFTTCAFEDTATPTKADLAFCTTIAQGTALFNGKTGDYALMLPTTSTSGATESYILWVELK